MNITKYDMFGVNLQEIGSKETSKSWYSNLNHKGENMNRVLTKEYSLSKKYKIDTGKEIFLLNE